VVLRADVWGLLCAVAAVGLLISHLVWLRRIDFVVGFVRIIEDSAGGVVRMVACR
jgi:hypothetical protein